MFFIHPATVSKSIAENILIHTFLQQQIDKLYVDSIAERVYSLKIGCVGKLVTPADCKSAAPGTACSTQATSTKFRGCSSAGRASALQAEGSGFESCHLHQIIPM